MKCLLAIIVVCRSGDIRLLGGTSLYEGRVEVCIDEDWGTICGDSWDQEGAMVVCRQLGYSTQGKGFGSSLHAG